VVLKVDQRTGDVSTSCHESVTVQDEHRKLVKQELKIERHFSSEGATSEVRSDLKGHRIDKTITGPDDQKLAVIHYDYRHSADKKDANHSVMAVQLDGSGRPVHQFVFATAGDIDKQKPAMREDRKYSEKDGLVKETHKVFDLHTGKDVPMFQSEQTLDLQKGRTIIHEQTFKDGKITPVEDKTATFNESGKAIALHYKNDETKTDVNFVFSSTGKTADVKGKLGDVDKSHLLLKGDVEVANLVSHYHVKAIDNAEILAHGGPTPPRHGDKPTGTVAWQDGDTYKQGSVQNGNVLDANQKVIGTINDAGDISIGKIKFNIIADQFHAAVFHGVGTDHERLDLCTGQGKQGGQRTEGYNGYLTDGQEKMTSIGGNIFDKQGKFFAHMDEKGQLVFANDTDQKEKKGTSLSNLKAGGGWQFIGNENGKPRQFDLDNSSNGTVFMAQLDAKGTAMKDAGGHPLDPVPCVVHMGMLIETATGKQLGKFVPPSINDDKSWGEGAVLLYGKNPTDKPTVTALSNMKNTIFDITINGQGSTQMMRGGVVGPKELQADGSTKPGVGGIVNFDQALTTTAQNLQDKKNALGLRYDTENKQSVVIGLATHDVTGLNARLYNKAIAGEEQTEAAQVSVDLAGKQLASQRSMIDQVLKTGKLDENTMYSLQRMTALNKDSGLDTLALLKQKIDNPQHVLEDLKGPADIYSGSIKRPDPDHAGKIIDYDIKNGYVYKKNSDHIVGSVNPADGSLRLCNDAGRAEVSKMADPSLKGTVIHLDCPTDSGKTTSVDWVNDGHGKLISVGQVRRQVAEERAYAELMAKGDTSDTTARDALKRTKDLEVRYTTTLDGIVKNGITDVNSADRFSALEQLKGGPQSFVKAEQYRPEPHALEKKITVPKFTHQEDCQRANGPMRLGHDHYYVDKGVIYRTRLEGDQWKKVEQPCGNLEANYVARIDGHAIVLRDQSQFLFQLRLEGEPQDHRIIGLGPTHTDGGGNVIPGGLVDANELLRQGAFAQRDTAVSAKEYRDSEGIITLGAPDAAMGGREAQLDLVHDTAANQQRGMHRQINQLFIEGLSGNTLATADVNHNVRSVQNFVRDMHLSTEDASNLSAEGREMQKQSSEAVAMAALSVVPGGAGLLTTRLGLGLTERVGITMLGGGLVSTVARQTRGGDWQQARDNFASGSVEALTMWAGSEGTQLLGNLKMIQAARVAGPEAMAALSEPLKALVANPATAKVLEIMAKPGGTVVVEGLMRTANAGIQTTGFATAGSIRANNYEDQFTPYKLAEGTLYMLAGEGFAALAHNPLTKMGPKFSSPFGESFDKGIETFSGSAINNFTNSALNARNQAIEAEKDHIAQQLGVKRELITPQLFDKYKNDGRINSFILHSAAEGAFMTVVTHPVSHAFTHFIGEPLAIKDAQARNAQLYSEQIASIEARVNALPEAGLAVYSTTNIKNDVGLETSLVHDHKGQLSQVALPDGTVLTRGEHHWSANKLSPTFSNIKEVTADREGNLSIKHTNNAETNIFKDGRTTERRTLAEGHELVKTCFPDGRTSSIERVDGKVTSVKMEKPSQTSGTAGDALPSGGSRSVEETKVIYDEKGVPKNIELFSGGNLVKDESGWSLYYSGQLIEKGSFSDIQVLSDGTIIKEGKSRKDGLPLSIIEHPDGSQLVSKNGVVDRIHDAKGYVTQVVRDSAGNPSELKLPGGDRLTRGDDGWSIHVSGHPPEHFCKEISINNDGSVVQIDEHGIASIDRLDGSRSFHVPGDSVGPIDYHNEKLNCDRHILSMDDPVVANHIQEGLLDLHDRLRKTHDAPEEVMGRVLYEVNRLLEKPGYASAETRRRWVDEALSLAANPDFLSQGTNGTCPLASSEQREYARHPDTWFKMLRRLNETGVAINGNGGVIESYVKDGHLTIVPDEGALSHYNEPGRTRRDGQRLEVSQIIQTVLNDVIGIQNGGRKDLYYATDIERMLNLVTGRKDEFVVVSSQDSQDMARQLLKIKMSGNLPAIVQVDASNRGVGGLRENQGHVQIVKDIRSSLTDQDRLSPDALSSRYRMDGMAIKRSATVGGAEPEHELDTERIEVVFGNTWRRGDSNEVLTADQAYHYTLQPKTNDHLDKLEARIRANSTDPHERLELLSWKLGLLNSALVHRMNNTVDAGSEYALSRLGGLGAIDSTHMMQELTACETELKRNYLEREQKLRGAEAVQNLKLGINNLLDGRLTPFEGGVELSLRERQYIASLGELRRALTTVQAMEIHLANRPASTPTLDAPSSSVGAGQHQIGMVSNDVQRAIGTFQDYSGNVSGRGEPGSDLSHNSSNRLEMRSSNDNFNVRGPARVFNRGDSQTLDALLFRQLKIDDNKCFQDNVLRKFVRDVSEGTRHWEKVDPSLPESEKKEIIDQRRGELERLLGKVFNNLGVIAPQIEVVSDEKMNNDDAAYVKGKAVIQIRESRFLGNEPLKIEEIGHEGLGHLVQDHLVANKSMLDALRNDGRTNINDLIKKTSGASQEYALTPKGEAFCANIALHDRTSGMMGFDKLVIEKSLLASVSWLETRLTKSSDELQADPEYRRADRLAESFTHPKEFGTDQLQSLTNLLLGHGVDGRMDADELTPFVDKLLKEPPDAPLPYGFNPKSALAAMLVSSNKLFGYDPFSEVYLSRPEYAPGKRIEPRVDQLFESLLQNPKFFDRHPDFLVKLVECNTETNPTKRMELRQQWLDIIKSEYPGNDHATPTTPKLLARFDLKAYVFLMNHFAENEKLGNLTKADFASHLPSLVRELIKDNVRIAAHQEYSFYRANFHEWEAHHVHLRMKWLIKENDLEHKPDEEDRTERSDRQLKLASTFDPDKGARPGWKKAIAAIRENSESPDQTADGFTSVLQNLNFFKMTKSWHMEEPEDEPSLDIRESAGIPDDYMPKANWESAQLVSDVKSRSIKLDFSGFDVSNKSDETSDNTAGTADSGRSRVQDRSTGQSPDRMSMGDQGQLPSGRDLADMPQQSGGASLDTPLSPPQPLPYEHHQKLEALRIQNNISPIRLYAKPIPGDSEEPKGQLLPETEKALPGRAVHEPANLLPDQREDLYRERTPDMARVEELKVGSPLVTLGREMLRDMKNDPGRDKIALKDPNQLDLIQQRKNREKEEAYTRLTYIDPLTGAGTQQAVEQELIRRCEEAQKSKVPFNVAYIDLDEFGTANRAIGRPGGDLALTMFVEQMQTVLLKHPSVSLARLGGDEFVLIGSFDESFLNEVRAIRLGYEKRNDQAFVRLLRENETGTGPDPVRASIGAVAWRQGESPEQILKRADKAMQANKELRKFDHPLRKFDPETDAQKAPSADAITSKFHRQLSMTTEEFRAKNPDMLKKDNRSHEASAERLILAKRLYTHHLTELPKDFVCQRVLGREVVQAKANHNDPDKVEQKLFLIKADINNFKSVNDENDHSQGDALLKIYGADLQEIVGRGKDKFVGSPGGGAAFIIAHSEAEMKAIVAKLKAWQGPEDMQPKGKYKLCLSIGVAEWSPGQTAATLDEKANAALDTTKRTQEKAGLRKSHDQYAVEAKVKEEKRRAQRNILDRDNEEL
jgi:diguanylate cyclase (GGDEF)-like protein